MTEKGVNLFDDCAAECVYIYMDIYIGSFRKKSVFFFQGYRKIYIPGTMANLQTDKALTKTNKTGAVARLRILVELGIL